MSPETSSLWPRTLRQAEVRTFALLTPACPEPIATVPQPFSLQPYGPGGTADHGDGQEFPVEFFLLWISLCAFVMGAVLYFFPFSYERSERVNE